MVKDIRGKTEKLTKIIIYFLKWKIVLGQTKMVVNGKNGTEGLINFLLQK